MPERPRPAPRSTPPEDGSLSDYADVLLRTMAERHPLKLTPAQLGAFAGRSHNSSAFERALAQLRKLDLVENAGGTSMRLTEEGRRRSGAVKRRPATSEALQDGWRRILDDYQRSLFDVLVDHQGQWVTREDLARLADKSAGSSKFENSISFLRRNDLAELKPGHVRASQSLFLKASS